MIFKFIVIAIGLGVIGFASVILAILGTVPIETIIIFFGIGFFLPVIKVSKPYLAYDQM